MSKYLQTQIEATVKPIVDGLGFQWAGVQILNPRGQRCTVRCFIDKEAGVTIEDCAKVSRQVMATLRVVGPQLDYTLEVSSPGLGRLNQTSEA